ncbi:MAG: ROK family protein [Spirochaetaceae bacterium]|nr:MAG: ROK family protein [Spirochaetaceae bacterium]
MRTDSAAQTVAVADIGGTNTTIALMQSSPSAASSKSAAAIPAIRILDKRTFPSGELGPINRVLAKAVQDLHSQNSSPAPSILCVGAAGPVKDGRCRLTNLQWQLDAAEIKQATGLPVRLINDFSAVCLGIPQLLQHRPDDMLFLTSARPQIPLTAGSTLLAIGAGTGLGAGLLQFDPQNGGQVLSGEAGHSSLPVFDQPGYELFCHLQASLGADGGSMGGGSMGGGSAGGGSAGGGRHPSAENAISGRGISRIYRWLAEKAGQTELGQAAASASQQTDPIPANVPQDELPALVSQAAAKGDPLARQAMQLFVRLYAVFASNMAVSFLPDSGLYIAGGIAGKNVNFFTENSYFMNNFLPNEHAGIQALLKSMPVAIVQNYDVSLYGAAVAALEMTNAKTV